MAEQLALFDLEDEPTTSPPVHYQPGDFNRYRQTVKRLPLPEAPPPTSGINREELAKYALLYTATEKGNHSGVRFAMSIEDAQAWCSSKVSGGPGPGAEWRYFYTSALNFIDCYWGAGKPVFDHSRDEDNGEWDERIAALGLTKIGFDEFADTFGPLGIEFIPPKKRR